MFVGARPFTLHPSSFPSLGSPFAARVLWDSTATVSREDTLNLPSLKTNFLYFLYWCRVAGSLRPAFSPTTSLHGAATQRCREVPGCGDIASFQVAMREPPLSRGEEMCFIPAENCFRS